MKSSWLLGLLVVLLLSITLPVSADVVSTSGLTVVTPPSGANITSDFVITYGLPAQIIFNERQSVTLASPLVTDTGTIAAGTVVDSQFFAVNSDAEAVVDTSATFDGKVLGIIYLDSSSNYTPSDFLGLSTLLYNESCGNCGFESGDTASFSGNTASFHTDYSVPGDFARVITLASPSTTPEPSSLVLIGAGLLGVVKRVRRLAR